jgi:protein tyrosine phosphatase (PTP) superfamily phosphohydrolase (DUF442 family)
MNALEDIYNYIPLSDTLLTSGQPTEAQFQSASRAGVQTVINLALATSDNALPAEASLVRQLGMEHIHIPVQWEHPSLADLDSFFNAMEAHKGEKILVHCAANMRVSAFVALYRIMRLGWDQQAALKDTNRIWDPFQNPVWAAFLQTALAQKR